MAGDDSDMENGSEGARLVGGGARAQRSGGGGSGSGAANAKGSVPVKFIIVASVCSSVSLIIVNKAVMKSYGFQFVLWLTAFHFVCTAAAMAVLARNGVFTPTDRVPTTESLKMAAAGVGSIVFMNLSLKFNSVGTYQMMKLACIPVVMALSYALKGERYSRKRIASLAVLLFGIAVATVNDVQMRFIGFLIGAVAVLTTALFQTWQGSKQKDFDVSPMQLLLAVAPWQAAITLLLACLFEIEVFAHTFQSMEVFLIAVSGCIAVSVNLCSMGLIGKTSPVVYQVVGHAKTCLILLGGYLLFSGSTDNPDLAKNLLGVAIAMGGVFWYTHLRLNDQ